MCGLTLLVRAHAIIALAFCPSLGTADDLSCVPELTTLLQVAAVPDTSHSFFQRRFQTLPTDSQDRHILTDVSNVDSSSQLSAMVVDLFGGKKDAYATARQWRESKFQSERELWLSLTRKLFAADSVPFRGYQPASNMINTQAGQATTVRASLDHWNAELGAQFAANIPGSNCAETGDGHFLQAFSFCEKKLSLDAFDEKADVKLDLNVSPDKAIEAVKSTHGTIDLLLSHQVFEHLSRPSVGMANLNAMLREGGRLVFSTPFVVQDHTSPHDFFRYTVRNIRTLLECGGFSVQTLQGRGSELIGIAYLAGVPANSFSDQELYAFCDGLSAESKDCENRYYSMVGAVGTKVKSVTAQEITDCYG